MSKTVFIINGKAGSGKDTFVDYQKIYALKNYHITIINISTVDKVKEAAKILGWNGVKDDASRKFLSDLKDLSTAFCDSPAQYCYSVVDELKDDEWLYIHCREPEEIDKMRSRIGRTVNCYTVFIKRDGVEKVTSNHADMNVDNYSYDFIIENNSILEDFAKQATLFVDEIYKVK